LLSEMHTDEGDKLQQHVRVSRAEGAAKGRSGDPVCELWVQGVC